ncbi:acyltransferase family protein [Cellulosilyticum sp. I15G10I2]|uniref:acyltransferase family protein n=1 Tax=Cellulosilyticum sp. I15G10I2 TaxID=1892843 RepID=UPI00085C3CEC|nr:acyltransferase family protein [Cellulosilyticum sp. I15G10I2]
MEQIQRNYLIDNLKGLLIFFVVFGHVIEYYIQGNSFFMGVYLFIYLFHMPLFVFISGYLSKNIDKCRKGAIKNLLIPYIVFNIIWYALAYIATGDIMLLIIYPGWTLWYLISLFFWRVMLKYLIRIKYILPISIICGLLIGVMPRGGVILSLSRTVTFLPFFLIGYYTNEARLNKVSKISKRLSVAGIAVAVIAAFYLSNNNLLDYNFLYHSQSYIYSGLTINEGMLFRAVLYIGASLLSICVLNLLPRKKVFFTNIGQQTMNIYLFHPYLIIAVYAIIHVLKLLSFNTLGYFMMILSPIIIIYLLSRKMTDKLYNGLFNNINKVVYHHKIWEPCKKQYTYVRPKIIFIRRKILGF